MLLKDVYKEREDEEEDVSGHWMILNNRKILELQVETIDTTCLGTGYGPGVRHTTWWW
jgi:hypothetical protein